MRYNDKIELKKCFKLTQHKLHPIREFIGLPKIEAGELGVKWVVEEKLFLLLVLIIN